VKNPAILALRWNNMELRVMQQFPISGPMRIDIEQLGETCILHCRGRFVAGQDQEYMQSTINEIRKLVLRPPEELLVKHL